MSGTIKKIVEIWKCISLYKRPKYSMVSKVVESTPGVKLDTIRNRKENKNKTHIQSLSRPFYISVNWKKTALDENITH